MTDKDQRPGPPMLSGPPAFRPAGEYGPVSSPPAFAAERPGVGEDAIARAIADGFSDGNEQFENATIGQQERYRSAARAVINSSGSPAPVKQSLTTGEESEAVHDVAIRLLLDEINPAQAEQVRRGIRNLEESTIDGAAVLRAICHALHYAPLSAPPIPATCGGEGPIAEPLSPEYTPFTTLDECANAALKAVHLLEYAEEQHANCPECEGEGVPELCGECFPHFDAARVQRRLVMQSSAALSPTPVAGGGSK